MRAFFLKREGMKKERTGASFWMRGQGMINEPHAFVCMLKFFSKRKKEEKMELYYYYFPAREEIVQTPELSFSSLAFVFA